MSTLTLPPARESSHVRLDSTRSCTLHMRPGNLGCPLAHAASRTGATEDWSSWTDELSFCSVFASSFPTSHQLKTSVLALVVSFRRPPPRGVHERLVQSLRDTRVMLQSSKEGTHGVLKVKRSLKQSIDVCWVMGCLPVYLRLLPLVLRPCLSPHNRWSPSSSREAFFLNSFGTNWTTSPAT